MNRFCVVLVAVCMVSFMMSAEAKVVVALNPFSASEGLQSEQSAISDVMQTKLSRSKDITLVDRDQLRSALNELKLGQAGMLTPESARELGKIVGAQYFCSGNINKSGDKVMATVKVIDVETTITKLDYAFVNSEKDAVGVGEKLASQVEEIVAEFGKEKAESGKASVVHDKKAIPDSWEKPSVMVIVKEMHVKTPELIDPAGETEVIKHLLDNGFSIIDSEYVVMMKADRDKASKSFQTAKTSTKFAQDRKADILIYGEAISERGASVGDFEGCRARIELKAIDTRTDKVLVSETAEAGATDLSEAVAGKKAIAAAADKISDKFIYNMTEKWNKK